MNRRWPRVICDSRKRWIALKRLLHDGRLEIYKNIGERDAALYLVFETAKPNVIESKAYIADVSTTIAGEGQVACRDDLAP